MKLIILIGLLFSVVIMTAISIADANESGKQLSETKLTKILKDMPPDYANLLDSDAILSFKSAYNDDDDDSDKTIDELMPNGGDDVIDDGQQVKTRGSMDGRYAPGNESIEHFEKMTATDFNVEDVKKYERQDAIGTNKRLWISGVIPYEFDEKILGNKKYKDKIYTAMKEWEEKTCIKFKPYSAKLARQLWHDQRIRFKNNGADGCWSIVGMQPQWKRPQTVSLTDGCMNVHAILHELGHAIGLHHEHRRHDRDDYVTVIKENIKPGWYKRAFGKLKNDSPVSTPYDFTSIMHYGKNFFGMNDGGTMIPKDKYKCFVHVMGKLKHLSHYDHQYVNSLYGCTKGCPPCRKVSADGFIYPCYSTKTGKNGKCHCVCLDEKYMQAIWKENYKFAYIHKFKDCCDKSKLKWCLWPKASRLMMEYLQQ